MKLYVCYGTWRPAPRPGGHPCGKAYEALKDAGYEPEVKLAYGLGRAVRGFLNDLSSGRREVKRLTGNYWVPALVTDDGDRDPGVATRSSSGRRRTRRRRARAVGRPR